ncbi:MAG: iron ABC transporter permease [Actinomycetaceae bacterium]|nr:iron ABC transporter permease [Actinomycetaceae bacterium]
MDIDAQTTGDTHDKQIFSTLIGIILTVLTISITIIALGLGDYYVSPIDVIKVLIDWCMRAFSWAIPNEGLESVGVNESTVILKVRLPRILLALLIGGGLAVSGATLQAILSNPLVSPDIIGVSQGASFGGVLAIMLGLSSAWILGGAMIMGICAVGILLSFASLRSGSHILTVVLGGIVTASFFQALVSLVTYLADPYTTLPSITFWLMGSLSNASWKAIAVAFFPITCGFILIYLLRWRINILALGDEDAMSLGVNSKRLRIILISVVSLIVASTVAVAGVVGWIGLVIPHLMRLIGGNDYRHVIPFSFLAGASFLTFIDTIARIGTSGEIPLGVLTALIGAPFFAYLLLRQRNKALSYV